MVVGIIGVGVVGGTLKAWFEENTAHDIRCHDPYKGMNDSLDECDAIFISVPVKPAPGGQDHSILAGAVELAKRHTKFVFIRSTVLPGTNDKFGTISMPEYLTERQALEDMKRYPVLVGPCDLRLLERLFPNKQFVMVTNTEAELAKFTHNCFGAMKVTYFNMIYKMCSRLGADFENVKMAANITGFVGETHTQVPGPDGHFGYGGKCFPENMRALNQFLQPLPLEAAFIESIEMLNDLYRTHEEGEFTGAAV